MGWQPGKGDGAGDKPGPLPSAPGSSGASASREGAEAADQSGVARDRWLDGFEEGGAWDTCLPGPVLSAVLARVAGPRWRCPGATDDELIGILRRLTAMESWAAAGRLAVIRELIRRDDMPRPGRAAHDDLPDEWSETVNREISLALGVTAASAAGQSFLAWDLGARLPGIAALLEDGTLSLVKTRIISEVFALLPDADAARAEAMLIARLAGAVPKTPGQVAALAAKIAAQVDPGLAERRRKAAQKEARVELFREASGTAALSGRDLPPDEALAANANVQARAEEYKDSGVFGDARMDEYRSTAYVDLLSQTAAWERIARGHLVSSRHGPESGPDAPGSGTPGSGTPGPGTRDPGTPGPDDPGPGSTPGAASSARDPAPGPPASDGPGVGGSPATNGERDGMAARSLGNREQQHAYRPRLTDLVLPLVTLQRGAGRPGESHGFGILDPDLCRHLAALALRSPHTTVCVTVTDPDGIAIGHGCLRAIKRSAGPPGTSRSAPRPTLPARINLTITAERLLALLATPPRPPGGAGPSDWSITPSAEGSRNSRGQPPPSGDPDWSRRWTIRLPGDAECIVRLVPVPTHSCDHRYESHRYQPNGTLRHLIQVRDRTCTFPTCSRHARASDFEHAVPYDKGGRTCSCNAGARSRSCHKVKQSKGWTVTQPKPGWHQWQAPSGRTYTQAPYQYPV